MLLSFHLDDYLVEQVRTSMSRYSGHPISDIAVQNFFQSDFITGLLCVEEVFLDLAVDKFLRLP